MHSSKITVRTEGAPLISVRVDHTTVIKSSGTGNIELAPGRYSVCWAVMGAPGEGYVIEVAEPRRLAWKWTAILDSSGKDAGIYWLEV